MVHCFLFFRPTEDQTDEQQQQPVSSSFMAATYRDGLETLLCHNCGALMNKNRTESCRQCGADFDATSFNAAQPSSSDPDSKR